MMSLTGRKRKERPLTSYFAPLSAEATVNTRPSGETKNGGGNVEQKRDKKEESTVLSANPPDFVILPTEGGASDENRSNVDSSTMKDDNTIVVSHQNSCTGLRIKTESKGSVKMKEEEEIKSSAGAVREGDLHPSMHNSIVWQLLKRSCLGSRVKVSPPRTVPWKTPTWLNLGPGPSGCATYGVDCLAWDNVGVLLACACTDGIIRVFDWDVVLAADMKGRNMWARNRSGSAIIDPVIQFPTRGRTVTFLKWNPFQHDEIAVGTSSSGQVYLYDLSEVAAWQQHPRGSPPCRQLDSRASSQSDSKFLFVDDGQHALLACGQDLTCWNLASGAMKWQLQWRRITCMESVSAHVVIVGSCDGQMALIDWKRTQRTAFSLKPSPTIVSQWLSYKGLRCPPPSAMGIRLMNVESSVGTKGGEVNTKVTWVTCCGWVLSTCVPSRRGNRPATIHSTTKSVRYVNSRGEVVDPPREAWSLPVGAVEADGCGSVLVYERVSDVTHILPHHDSRVLDSKDQQVRSCSKPGLVWFSVNSSSTVPIALSKRRGRPTGIAVHPGQEWIVVGTGSSGIYALNARCMVS